MSTMPKSCVRGHWRVPDPTPRATRLFLVGYCPGNSGRAGVMQQLWIYRAARHKCARCAETVIMGEPAEEQAKTVPTEDFSRRYAIEQTRMSLEAGVLGKNFGSSMNAPTNIAGFVVGILTLTIIVVGVLFMPSKISVLEYLDKMLPIMTGVLDYLFGKST